ncbi:MAG: hypothetical protein ABIF82_01480 [Planctomycetota bacterium]
MPNTASSATVSEPPPAERAGRVDLAARVGKHRTLAERDDV